MPQPLLLKRLGLAPHHEPTAQVLSLPGQRMGTLMPKAERMQWDKDTPLNVRVSMLAELVPDVPHHMVHTVVHNSPDQTVEELRQVLELLSPEEVAANSQRSRKGCWFCAEVRQPRHAFA